MVFVSVENKGAYRCLTAWRAGQCRVQKFYKNEQHFWDLSGRMTAFIISHLYVRRQSTRADHHQRLDIDQARIVPCTICAGRQWSTCALDACVQLGLSSDLRELHGQRVHFASSRLLVALHAATKPR